MNRTQEFILSQQRKTLACNPRRFGSEDKAALTCERIAGRSTLAQQDRLSQLGFPREKAISLTRYMAAKKIIELIQKNTTGHFGEVTEPLRKAATPASPQNSNTCASVSERQCATKQA